MALFRGPKAPQLGLVASSASLRNGQTQLVVIISVWICGLFRATQHRYQQQAVGEYTMLGPRTSTRRNDDNAGARSRGDVNRISNPRPRERSFASHKTTGASVCLRRPSGTGLKSKFLLAWKTLKQQGSLYVCLTGSIRVE